MTLILSSPTAAASVRTLPELCVVIPVLNERDNVAPLVERLRRVLDGVAWECIYVDDDSTDGTRDEVARIAAADPRVRLLHRIGRRGLSTAFVEGAQASLAPFVAAMDGDMQHDEALLPGMLAVLRADEADLVVGSRYVAGGGVGEWDRTRAGMSDLATRLSRLVLKVEITDPMSGFFMVRRATFDRGVRRLSAMGFKILLDLVASLPEPPRVRELPYRFRVRVSGESKLDAGVLRDYLMLLADKLVGHVIPVRFIMFAMVGALGLVAHVLVLWFGLDIGGLSFNRAQALATGCAIVGNFTANNLFTFRDRRLRGWDFLRGLLTFALVSSVGAVGNIGVASFVFGTAQSSWWVAGLVGAAMSLVWNYAASSIVTWRRG